MRSFIGVAEQLHFGRAAAQLNVVQSAVSQQIRLLEEELGVKLLDRSRHHVELTEAGRVFLPEARRTLLQAEAAARAARAADAGTVGRLEFGFVDNAVWSAMPSVLRLFRERYPGIDLKLHQMDRNGLIRSLEEGSLDIALMPDPLPGAGGRDFVGEVLLQAPFLVALPRGHALARQKRLALRKLAAEPFVLFPPAMQTRLMEIVSTACAGAGFRPRVVQEALQIHTLLALVGAGFGITLVPAWAAAVRAPGIVYRPVSTAMPDYALLTVSLRASTNAAVRTFRQLAEEARIRFKLAAES